MDSDSLHIWTGTLDPKSAETWVNEHLAREQQFVDELLALKYPRTVENTLWPYDNAQNELNLAASQAWLMNAVYPNDEVRDVAQALTQKVSEAATALSLNQEVYRALAAVDLSSADAATRHYMDRTLLQYRLAGVDKDEATRRQIKQRFDRINELSLQFSRNVRENVNRLSATKDELEGLPADFVADHPASAGGSIALTTNETDYRPVMTYAANPALRKRMYMAYRTRAYPVNKDILVELLKTRYEVAHILGFAAWADLAIADQMMGSTAKLRGFFEEADKASRAAARREYEMILAFARQKQPGMRDIAAYDGGYWAEQYRRAAFDFDSQSVRPYFPYEAVERGVLDIAARLFQVQFQRADVPVWDASVSAWDVVDNGNRIGRFYLDMHPREGKDKWFSSAPVVPGIRGRQLPEGVLICNFPGGRPGDPGLMKYEDVVTYFHEFGHLMHNILGGAQPWSGVTGFSTELDFVESPSQMLEEFFRDPAILRSFARHYQTGELLPLEIIGRMNRASAFGRAAWVQGQLFYSSYALHMHDRAPEELDLDALLRADFTRFLPYTFVDGDRFYAAFTHAVGYSSNLYTYLLDKVIALDFFSQFDRRDLLDGPAAMRYRRTVLEPGGAKPGTELVRGFLGRPQNFTAFQAWMDEEFREEAKPGGSTAL